MRRIVVIVALLAIGGMTLVAVTGPEPTPAALYMQAVELLASDSPYQGELAIKLAVEPGSVSDPAERLVLESLRDLELGVSLQKKTGELETVRLAWQGQTIPLEASEVAASWWQQFTPEQLLTKGREEYQIAGTLSVASLLPATSQSDPVSLLLQDLTAGLEQIPATLILKPHRHWLRMVYQVHALEFSWSQTLDGDQLASFPLGSQTKSVALDLRGRLEIISQVMAE